MRAAVLLLGVTAIACGHTQIVTSHPGAAIWVDGVQLGNGAAEVRRTGFPDSMHVRVEYRGESVERSVRRSFTMTTLVAGFFTYFSGWAWAWQYPESIYVPIEVGAAAEEGDPWAPGGSDDPWMRPLAGARPQPVPPSSWGN